MLLTNDFVVAADLDRVWEHLLDMEGVAACVPGARVEEVIEPSTYKGTIRLRIGPMTVEYRGQATLVSVDDETHSATIDLKAREARGQGSALATVRNRLEPAPGGTRVIAETELQITGPQAQFGKGVLEDVGGRILEEFSTRLERQISDAAAARAQAERGGDSANGQAPPARTPRGVTAEKDDVLDLNKALSSSILGKAAKVGGVAAAVLAVLAVLLRKSRGRGSRARQTGRRG